jgi:hypothetical protein
VPARAYKLQWIENMSLKTLIRAELATLADKTWIRAELAAVAASIERVETSLLTEFHKWSSPAEMRIKSHSLAIRALDLEVETLTERVEKLEPNH